MPQAFPLPIFPSAVDHAKSHGRHISTFGLFFFFFFCVRAALPTPQWTQHSNHTAKYYIMSFPELIFNFLTPLHEKFSNCLGGHLEVCADLIAGVNVVSAQMQTFRLSEEFL